jgi:hypothetical protein
LINTDYQESTTTAAGGDTRATPPQSEENTGDIGSAPVSFITSEYLTVDITNGKKATLEELRQQFPRIAIFKLPHLVLFGNHISLYKLDRNLGVTK